MSMHEGSANSLLGDLDLVVAPVSSGGHVTPDTSLSVSVSGSGSWTVTVSWTWTWNDHTQRA